MLLQAGDLAWCLDQAHGELVALHQEGGRVGGLRLYGRAEAVQGILRYYSRVVEPLPVGLDTGDRRIAVLVDSSLGDVSLGVALSLAICEALENLDLLRIAGKLLVNVCWKKFAGAKKGRRKNIPVEVGALDLDIAHAIARLALTLLADLFFLLDTHCDCFLEFVELGEE